MFLRFSFKSFKKSLNPIGRNYKIAGINNIPKSLRICAHFEVFDTEEFRGTFSFTGLYIGDYQNSFENLFVCYPSSYSPF